MKLLLMFISQLYTYFYFSGISVNFKTYPNPDEGTD